MPQQEDDYSEKNFMIAGSPYIPLSVRLLIAHAGKDIRARVWLSVLQVLN